MSAINKPFRLKVADAKLLRDYVATIGVLLDEATFKVEKDGFKLRDMDRSHVAMIDFAVPPTFFDGAYEVSENTRFCVSIPQLHKFLLRAGKDESVELNFDDKTGKLYVKIASNNKERAFNLPALEASEDCPPTPNLSFNVQATVATGSLSQAAEDAQLVSDTVKMTADQDKIALNATGDTMNADMELVKGTPNLLDLAVKEKSQSVYSLLYLASILKAAALTSELATFEFSTDMPLKIDFRQPGDVNLTFFLAPRIETQKEKAEGM